MKSSNSRKNQWKYAIRAHILKEKQKAKESGQFWQDSVEFDYDFELNGRYDDKVEQLFELLKEPGKRRTKVYQKMRDLQIVLGNLLSQTRKPIAVSMNRNDYVKNPYMSSSLFTMKIIDWLHKLEFIEKKPGFYDKENPSSSRKSRITATAKLLKYFQ